MARRRAGFTTRASCLLAAGATAVLCGVLLGETDLTRAGALAAAVPCVAAIVVHRSRVQVANRRSVDPPRASAGNSVVVHLTITNRSVLPSGALMLEDQLPDRLVGKARFVLESLGGREARTVSYRMPNLGRGRYRVGPLRVRLTDPFHMIDLSRSFTATSDFVVTPVVDELPPTEPARSDDLGDSTISHSVGVHGADDASTREYRTGDDLRKIHWRSSARTGALMVRQEERPWRAQTTVLLDTRTTAHGIAPEGFVDGVDPRETSSFEWAVSAAATIGTQALRAGRVLDLIGDPGRPADLRFADPDTYATYLAGVREAKASTLDSVNASIRTAARDSALVAVLGRVDAHALRLLADAHPRGQVSPAFAMLLDVDSWTSDPDAPVRGGGLDPEKAAGVLRAAGWRVTVVRSGTTTRRAWELLLAGFAMRSGRGVEMAARR